MPLAFSYLRFSSPQQAAGDSVRRQTTAAIDWCRRNKIELDTSLSLRDEGVSAYRGKHRENPDTHALAGFLQAVRLGRVQNGSYLIVESLDRLSREKIRPALTLLLNLIESGIKVVQLLPAETVYDEDVEPMQLMMAVMELNLYCAPRTGREKWLGEWGIVNRHHPWKTEDGRPAPSFGFPSWG